jgi:hypothetical protein
MPRRYPGTGARRYVDDVRIVATLLGRRRRRQAGRSLYLRRHFEKGTGPTGQRTVTDDDWHRSAEVFADLDDSTVMDAAWR